jgi:hypothetical protein
MNVISETPETWLRELFEFEYCAECGGDAEDHEVCIVPGMGTFFARCLRVLPANAPTDEAKSTGNTGQSPQE